MADILDDKAGTVADYALELEYRVTVLRRCPKGKEVMLVDRTEVMDLVRAKAMTTRLFNRSMHALRRHDFKVVAGYFATVRKEPYRMAYGILTGRMGRTLSLHGGYDLSDKAQDHGEPKRWPARTLDNDTRRKIVNEDMDSEVPVVSRDKVQGVPG